MKHALNRWIVFGATSAIATAVLRSAAKRGTEVCLVSRSQEALDRLRQDLLVRGAKRVETIAWDVSNVETQAALMDSVRAKSFSFDTALVAYGNLPDQAAAEQDPVMAAASIGVNFTSAASLLLHVANEMQSPGVVAVVTSVAGEMGRRSNYVYGSAKGGLSTFLSGLRARLHEKSIAVVDVRPGFIDTPMTSGFKKGALFASPEKIAPAIVCAMKRGKPVVHVPFFWRWILLILCAMPRKLLYRLPI